eukprot:12823966-Heterocapsa_arctica.AAC.1
MRKRKDEQSQPDLQPGKKVKTNSSNNNISSSVTIDKLFKFQTQDENPVVSFPKPIPSLEIAIPGVAPIPTNLS